MLEPRSQHNWLRITRVVRSLGLLGFAYLQAVRPAVNPASWPLLALLTPGENHASHYRGV